MKAILVGYGLAGKVFHAPLLKTAGIEVAAIVTTDEARRVEAQQDCPQALLCESLAEAMSLVQNELVIIATPSATHAPLAIEALRAGRNVVIDKPVALSAHEFAQVIDVADQSMRMVIPFQNRRWDADFLTLSQLLESGELGQIKRYEARFDRYAPQVKDRWREHDVAGAGLLYDLAPHLVDQAVQLFGRPDWVFCTLMTQRQNAMVTDAFELIMGSKDPSYPYITLGAQMFAAGANTMNGAPRYMVNGTEATWFKNGFDPQEDQLRQGVIPTKQHWLQENEHYRGRLIHGNSDQVSRTGAGVGNWPFFYEQVKKAIEEGETPPVLANEALITCDIIDAALESASNGERISL